MERFGIVGLPNAGKSSLFNALTGGDAAVEPYPFSTTETNVGVARVPDERVEALGRMSESVKLVHASAELVDIAGIQKGSSEGEGLGNAFLGGIRETHAVLMVLRAFDDANVVGGSDPLDDLHTLDLELVLADLASGETQLQRRRKAAKVDKVQQAEVALLETALAPLADGVPLWRAGLSDEQLAALKPFFLITAKPVLIVVNLDASQVEQPEAVLAPVLDDVAGKAEVLGVSVALELEMADFEPDERAEMRAELGLGEGALPRVANAAYHLLGLRTFLTTGDKETRAWTFRAGATAPECAGVIHSDLQRGFIRAEVIRWDELLEIGSWSKAKDVGRIRLEGKEYRVADGDTMEIRYNV